MSKYRVTIELDLDFETIFKEIPEGLYGKGDDVDEHYKRETICDALKNCHMYALEKNINDLIKDKEDGMYKYLKHHNECLIQVSEQISKNFKIEKL
jgi:hypothetical protein